MVLDNGAHVGLKRKPWLTQYLEDFNLDIAGVYKKQSFSSRGGDNSYFDFLGKINSNFSVKNSKKEILL